MIQRNDNERMANLFIGNEFWYFSHRHEPSRQILAVVPMHIVFQPAVFNQHGVGFVA